MLGSIFLHLAVESSFPQSRRSSLATVERLAASLPEHTNLAILAACAAYLSREEKVVPTKTNATGDDAQESSASKASREARLPALMLACAAVGETCPADIKQRLLWDWVLVAHHSGPCEYFRSPGP